MKQLCTSTQTTITLLTKKGATTVSVRHGSSDNKRCTICVTVAADGTKLPFFVIVKSAVIGRIANNLHRIMHDGMYGCTQPKSWMENRVMQLWKEKVWKPYVEGTMRSALPLDRMGSHTHPDFIDTADELGTRVIAIPGDFTSVCQARDVGIVKPFKTRFTTLCQDWKVADYSGLGGTGKIPAQSRDEVLQWLNIAWRSISESIIQNYFRKRGFTECQDINSDVVLDLISNLFQIKVCSCCCLKLFWKHYKKKNEEKNFLLM